MNAAFSETILRRVPIASTPRCLCQVRWTLGIPATTKLELSFMVPPPNDELERTVIRAADSLVAQDAYLLTCDLNERSITHKFAEHLQRELPAFDYERI